MWCDHQSLWMKGRSWKSRQKRWQWVNIQKQTGLSFANSQSPAHDQDGGQVIVNEKTVAPLQPDVTRMKNDDEISSLITALNIEPG